MSERAIELLSTWSRARRPHLPREQRIRDVLEILTLLPDMDDSVSIILQIDRPIRPPGTAYRPRFSTSDSSSLPAYRTDRVTVPLLQYAQEEARALLEEGA